MLDLLTLEMDGYQLLIVIYCPQSPLAFTLKDPESDE